MISFIRRGPACQKAFQPVPRGCVSEIATDVSAPRGETFLERRASARVAVPCRLTAYSARRRPQGGSGPPRRSPVLSTYRGNLQTACHPSSGHVPSRPSTHPPIRQLPEPALEPVLVSSSNRGSDRASVPILFRAPRSTDAVAGIAEWSRANLVLGAPVPITPCAVPRMMFGRSGRWILSTP